MLLPITSSLINRKDEEGQEEEKKKQKSGFVSYAGSYKSSVVVGLRILIQLSQGESNIVVKPTLKMSKPATFRMLNQIPVLKPFESCFLKSCYLCNKNLSPDKDVYMYRGDQGFCSIECRSRQIHLDEMREIKISTKKIVAPFRHCNSTSGRRETRVLLEEFRRRHKPLSPAIAF